MIDLGARYKVTFSENDIKRFSVLSSLDTEIKDQTIYTA